MTAQIIRALSDQDLASLHVKFVVPLVIRDMLTGAELLDDVAEYTLDEIIGELHPDTAVLCIALCAQHLAIYTDHVPISRALKTESDRIIGDFGGIWLAHENGYPLIHNEEIMDLLINIPEDLESLGDLLLATAADLDESEAIPAILCQILGTQAHMHKDMSESHIDGLIVGRPAQPQPEKKTAATIDNGSNVVAFPGPK